MTSNLKAATGAAGVVCEPRGLDEVAEAATMVDMLEGFDPWGQGLISMARPTPVPALDSGDSADTRGGVAGAESGSKSAHES